MIAGRILLATAIATALAIGVKPVFGQLFESDSKRFGNSKMDIVVREEERRPRVSVLNVEVNARGSSVGSSFFILCSVRPLAQIRGNHRYVVKIEDSPKRGQMLVGFLSSREEGLDRLGEEFQASRPHAI